MVLTRPQKSARRWRPERDTNKRNGFAVENTRLIYIKSTYFVILRIQCILNTVVKKYYYYSSTYKRIYKKIPKIVWLADKLIISTEFVGIWRKYIVEYFDDCSYYFFSFWFKGQKIYKKKNKNRKTLEICSRIALIKQCVQSSYIIHLCTLDDDYWITVHFTKIEIKQFQLSVFFFWKRWIRIDYKYNETVWKSSFVNIVITI